MKNLISKTRKWRYVIAAVMPFLMLIISLYLIFGNIARDISSAKNEIYGLDNIRLLHDTTLSLQKIRDLTNIKLHGGNYDDGEINSIRKKIDADIREIIEDKHGLLFNFKKQIKEAAALFEIVTSKTGEDVDPHILFDLYSELIKVIIQLKIKVATSSNLILDPEADSYHLVNLLVNHLPKLNESVARSRGMAAHIAFNSGLTKETSEEMAKNALYMRHELDAYMDATGIIFETSEDLRSKIAAHSMEMEEAFENYISFIDRISNERLTVTPSLNLFDLGTTAIEKSDSLFKEISGLLIEILEQRISRLNNIILYTIMGILLTVTLIACFIFGFYISDRKSINLLKKQSKEKLKTKEELKAREKSNRAKDTIIVLSQIGFESMDYNLSLITEQAAATINAGRLSIWLFNDDRTSIVCHDLFINKSEVHEKGITLNENDFPLYFDAIKNNETIRADDAETYRCTREFTENYLRPLGITSMLDVPIWHNGVTRGVICCEHIGEKRIWTDEEVDFIGNLSLIVAQILEANELRRVEEERLRVIEDLNFANRELRDFAYIVSHDLKAPLRAIGSLTSWLREDYSDKLGGEGREQLDLLSGRVKRMNALIDGILTYSRAGKINEERSEVDLNDTLREVIDTIAPPENITVSLSNELPKINCEKTRIFQVFQNLISNGIKYMDKPDGEIKIGYTEENGNMVFSVSDNGPGIEEKYFERIFTIFQTLNARDDVEGTGVGLSLVKKIVEMYDGKVWIKSEIGKGSTFYFSLPAKMTA